MSMVGTLSARMTSAAAALYTGTSDCLRGGLSRALGTGVLVAQKSCEGDVVTRQPAACGG